MNLNWFLSSTVRDAARMGGHVCKILDAQRDLLSRDAILTVEKSMAELEAATRGKLDVVRLKTRMKQFEETANKWLKHYPNASIRENVEVLLVAMAVAMGIRTFFLQPFKIPTGSMQPTLYGVMPPLQSGNQPEVVVPNPVARFFDFWIHGVSYAHLTADADGELTHIGPVQRFLLFNLKQSYVFNGTERTIWFPPESLFERANIRFNTAGDVTGSRRYKQGDDIVRLKVLSGDHLFVDRISYNFRRPKRGDIVVFKTLGVNHPQVPQDQFYIKRLVGLGGEHLRIGQDHHLVVDGKRLDATTPGFEKLYNFDLNNFDGPYVGHWPVEIFADDKEFVVPPNHFLVMGDNTRNSLDGRYFGDFSQEYVIGKSFMVYWPFNRFGWNHR